MIEHKNQTIVVRRVSAYHYNIGGLNDYYTDEFQLLWSDVLRRIIVFMQFRLLYFLIVNYSLLKNNILNRNKSFTLYSLIITAGNFENLIFFNHIHDVISIQYFNRRFAHTRV